MPFNDFKMRGLDCQRTEDIVRVSLKSIRAEVRKVRTSRYRHPDTDIPDPF